MTTRQRCPSLEFIPRTLFSCCRGPALWTLALFLCPAPASANDPATTVGFVFGSVTILRKACGLQDDPDGLGRLLVNARLAKADILPGGRARAAFEAGADEARASLSGKLKREGQQGFCTFARHRYGATGLGVVRDR